MAAKHPKWKLSWWERDSIDPAMLRVPCIIVLFILLWALNLWLLDKARILYSNVIPVRTAPYSFIGLTALFVGVSYAFGMTIITTGLGFSIEAGLTVFYVVMLFVHLIPSLPGVENRSTFYRLVTLMFFPQNTITFPEVLLADAFCSLSKVLKDVGITIVAVYSYTYGTSVVTHHDNAMILIALLSSLPFAIRVRQCAIQLVGCPDNIARIPVVLNILKYMSSFPPIWLAHLWTTHPNIVNLMFYSALINSIYSFLWDVIMDWGFITIHRTGRIHCRQRLLLPLWVYVIAFVVNLVLRGSWAFSYLPGFQKLHSSVFVLIIEIGEVMRRSMWNVLRIEWEVIVQQDRAVNIGKEVPSDDEG